MAVEAFAKCPTTGCTVSVWGSTSTENPCSRHGGNRLGFPEVDDDEYGIPRASDGPDPSPGPRSASLEA